MTYTSPQVWLHWITAAIVLAMVASGLAYGLDLADDWAIKAHQVMGQLLIVVVVIRLAWRLTHAPQGTAPGPVWQVRLAGLVHIALYLLLIAYLVTGYVSASGLGAPTLLFPINQALARTDFADTLVGVHYALKWVLLGVISLHIAGALKHLIVDRTSSNMLSKSPERT